MMAANNPPQGCKTRVRLDRREFLRGTLRYASLTAVLAAAALARKPRPAGQSCTPQALCAGCSLLAECGLPRAVTARQSLPGGKP